MNLKRAMILAMIVALNVAMAFFILIPVPATNGNINLCDAGIIFAALLYGKREGAIVGGLSGLLLDLVSGYAIFMPFSLVVHGLEGFAVGAIAKRDDNKSKALAIVVGAIIVVIGYFITNTILYGVAAGIPGLLTDTIQSVVGSVVGLVLYHILHRVPQVQNS